MKKLVLPFALIGTTFIMNSQINIQNAVSYRNGQYDGTYIHGVDNLGNPAISGDPSFRELPSGVTGGVYSWWNYSDAIGEPSDSYGAAIGFGKGVAGSAEIWAGWTNGKLYTRFLRDCCQGWSGWNEIWTANTDGAGSGLDADTVDGLQPLLIQSSGYVGIGTTTPTAKLEVSSATSGDSVLKIESDTDNNNESDNPRIELRQDGGLHGAGIGFNSDWGGTSPDNLFRIVTRDSGIDDYNSFVINPMNRRVGIGTSDPDSKLSVNGNIHTKEVRVDLIGWPDYVFNFNYNLPTLKEVEQHIKEKGHLKDIPSAEEVKENGIFLGEMNSKLLQKIEELTLYTINQEKRIEALESKNEKLLLLVEKLLNKKIEE